MLNSRKLIPGWHRHRFKQLTRPVTAFCNMDMLKEVKNIKEMCGCNEAPVG